MYLGRGNGMPERNTERTIRDHAGEHHNPHFFFAAPAHEPSFLERAEARRRERQQREG
jgi:hypothetical protein